VEENIRRLGVAEKCELFCTSAFLWTKLRYGPHAARELGAFRMQVSGFRSEAAEPGAAWVVFCSPPYDFYVQRQPEMIELIGHLLAAAPPASVLVVEADQRLDFNLLPTPASDVREGEADLSSSPADAPLAGRRAPAGAWRVRSYPPAEVGILRIPPMAAGDEDSY
jgi:hypothetical protein